MVHVVVTGDSSYNSTGYESAYARLVDNSIFKPASGVREVDLILD